MKNYRTHHIIKISTNIQESRHDLKDALIIMLLCKSFNSHSPFLPILVLLAAPTCFSLSFRCSVSHEHGCFGDP